MKPARFLIALFAVATFGIPCLKAQKVYTVDDVPNTRLTDSNSAVSNPDGILSFSTVADVNRILSELQRNTSAEVAVVVVGSIGDQIPEDFAIDLFRKWGIGKASEDNGLLILLITGDRIVRFEVGYGLEAVITDAVSKSIQTVRMMPYLRSSDWDGAILEGVTAVSEYLSDPNNGLSNDYDANYAYYDGKSFLRIFLLMFGGIVIVMVVAFLVDRNKRKCPRCGAMMKVTGSQTTNISSGVRMITTTLKCPKCGYVKTRNTTQNIRNTGGGATGGFGGFGGGFGGSRGGSFGGGRSGGGGATTRF